MNNNEKKEFLKERKEVYALLPNTLGPNRLKETSTMTLILKDLSLFFQLYHKNSILFITYWLVT